MLIWLRGDASAVGIDSDVIRREDMSALSDIDQGFIDLQQHGARLLSQKHQEAAVLMETAERQAEKLLFAAQKKFDNSARLGYASGVRQATEKLHAYMLERMLDDRQTLARMQERLADIVVKAVRQLTMSDDRDGLYQRAATTVGRELSHASFLSVTVHPDDAARVRTVFATIAEQMRWPVAAEIIENQHAAPGACLCEWDYGIFDGGLNVQLQALQHAVKKVLQTQHQDEDANGIEQDE
jgi:type III secretion protein L